MTNFRQSFTLDKLLLALLRLAIFYLQGSHTPILNLLHMSLVILYWCNLQLALISSDFVQSILSFLVQKASFVNSDLDLVVLILCYSIIFHLSLLYLLLQPIKVLSHLPIDIDLTPLKLVICTTYTAHWHWLVECTGQRSWVLQGGLTLLIAYVQSISIHCILWAIKQIFPSHRVSSIATQDWFRG